MNAEDRKGGRKFPCRVDYRIMETPHLPKASNLDRMEKAGTLKLKVSMMQE